MKKLKVLYLAAEVAPYSKTGGLADVAGSLPRELRNNGVEIVVVTPKHGIVDNRNFEPIADHVIIEADQHNRFKVGYQRDLLEGGAPVYFVCHWEFFDKYQTVYGHSDAQRFYLYSLAALKLCEIIKFSPDIVHCNDWHAALALEFFKKRINDNIQFENSAGVLTIHNLAFQGEDPKRDDGHSVLPLFDSKKLKQVNFLKRGIINADALNAVSENYRDEILTKDYGEGLQTILKNRRKAVFGITNGIDEQIFSPLSDPNVPFPYGLSSLPRKGENKRLLQEKFGFPQESKIPLIGMMSRVSEQKGFDLVLKIVDELAHLEMQLLIIGSGDRAIINQLKRLPAKYPEKIAVEPHFVGPEVSSLVYAGCDMFVMPSRFEPCGLGQIFALRYGTIPIVRQVGGLADTIENYNPRRRTGNGFVFKRFNPIALYAAIVRAIETYHHQGDWTEIIKGVMRQSYSWEIPAKRYIKLYQFALKHKKAQ